MIKNLRTCRNCGVIFDLARRPHRDCPLCHHGEHLPLDDEKFP